MDLNDALHSCRCGAFIRDDANMTKDWKIQFVPNPDAANMRLSPEKRKGSFFYINPITGTTYEVIFRDNLKASFQWRTTL
jgi:hypothetical protein